MTSAFRLAVAACTGGIVTVTGLAAHADQISIRIGAGHPPAALWVRTTKDIFMNNVANRVAAETDHEIVWTEAWGGSVCKLGECLEAVESGILDMGEVQTPFEPSKMLAWNFSYFVPFGTGDPVLGSQLTAQTYQEVPALREQLELRYNQRYIGNSLVGNYGVLTNFTWDEISELKGHKLLAAGPNLPWVSSVGVIPVQGNLNEVYTGMQTGVYDGLVMFPDAAVSFKLHEVSKQFTIADFGVVSTPVLTINNDVWDSLPEDVQAIIAEEGRVWNEEAGKITARVQKEAIEEMRQSGVRILTLTEEQRQDWANRLPNIPAERTAEAAEAGQPADAIYKYIELLEAAGHTFPRDWAAERP